jgi:predicted signal transduction protein with EAL and GGDEF domain
MCTRLRNLADGILDASDRRMRGAHERWGRLTPGDFSGITNKQDLITSVEERYNLSHAAAVQDVELWDARVRGMFETTADSLARKDLSQ